MLLFDAEAFAAALGAATHEAEKGKRFSDGCMTRMIAG
jgi:hypothetical protein